ncbi:MAG: hypothetical protein E7295_10230 [Lachnospiraceae bacterium]|nr:hypothetical protein [Lachnospiraceae bacterium]
MKRLANLAMAACLILFMCNPSMVLAVGEGNIDHGGGGWGDGSDQNKWEMFDEGIRATVIDAETGDPVSISVDLSNANTSDIKVHFGKVSKSSYRNGTELQISAQQYESGRPSMKLPKIINTNSYPASIQDIKRYFTDEQVLRSIAGYVGMDFDVMIGGQYKLLIEPIAYVTFQGIRTAFTATEAALYNAKVNGLLRTKMPSLSHKNLPLALFLERDDAGYAAWTGSRTDKVNDSAIISSLGLGIVRFNGEEPSDSATIEYLSAPDYVYRTDTYVITTVTVSGGWADPSNPASVCFHILGQDYWATNVYYPEGGQQLAWVCWKTPSTPQTVEITVSSSRSLSKAKITANIVKLEDNPPPNPVADDVNPGWNGSLAAGPGTPERTSASWTLWKCNWHPNLKWEANWQWVDTGHLASCKKNCKKKHGHWEDQGVWRDYGWWEHELEYCAAYLYGSMNLSPDETSPTSNGDVTKSGYGVKVLVNADLGFTGTPYATGTQNAVTYFPEFYYGTYWRLLDHDGSGHYQFRANPYSTYGHRVHFTPIWMPDGQYVACTWVLDVWTPAGMLSGNYWDGVTISGNLWDDWHVAPENPD